MILNENYQLSNGVAIPKLGLGTWLIPNQDVSTAVQEALSMGYRHIDTAQAYRNEQGVGQGIRDSGVQREELFVTTKLAAEIKSYGEAVTSIDQSLSTLDIGYIDLMIIHSPKPWAKFSGGERYFEGNRDAWRALEEALKAGKLRAIGVSNFEQADLDNVLGACTVAPMVNQVLAHIGNTPEELIAYCRQKNILVEAYSPIGHGALLKNNEISAMAGKYGVSVPQLGIRYTLQLGMVSLPKTTNPQHMRSNADVDFDISTEDMQSLRNLKITDYGEAEKFPVFRKV